MISNKVGENRPPEAGAGLSANVSGNSGDSAGVITSDCFFTIQVAHETEAVWFETGQRASSTNS